MQSMDHLPIAKKCRIRECLGLSTERRLQGWCRGHYWRWKRHGDPRAGRSFPPGVPLAHRLHVLTDKSGGPNACWPWLGERQPNGYGKMRVNGHYRTITHLVYELDRGHPHEKPLVLHTCDNPPCVNPRHLWTGTHRDNAQDKYRKGRANHARGDRNGMRTHPGLSAGEKNGRARLSRRQVETIRRRYVKGRISQAALAEKYGVAEGTIRFIIIRRIWK